MSIVGFLNSSPIGSSRAEEFFVAGQTWVPLYVPSIYNPKGASSIPKSWQSKCLQALPNIPGFEGGITPGGKPLMYRIKSHVQGRSLLLSPSAVSPASHSLALLQHSPKCYTHKKAPPSCLPVPHCSLYSLLNLNRLQLLFFWHHPVMICYTHLSPARLGAQGVTDNTFPPATEHRLSKGLKSVGGWHFKNENQGSPGGSTV